jgi:molecular chaperone HtpG
MDNTKTIIGKDVIESLTLGMYEDSRFIYREYIQNAADQIDIAVEQGILNSINDGNIEITIDKADRNITIYDNATGIKGDTIQPILKNIAQGTKDRTKHKGFRGIGRLGGLAYCDKLIFETSYYGEDIRSILTWDAKKLKEIINDRKKKGRSNNCNR